MTILPNLTDIPSALRARNQWVVWRYEARDEGGKPTKVPYQARWPKRKASSQAPRTWATVEQAMSAAAQHSFDGIGYVFSIDDPFAGFDLDDMLDDQGHIAGWARAWLEELPTYIEVSPSGHGVKGIAIGKLPGAGINAGIVELYDQGRYFTITGQRFDDAPAEPQPVNGALDRLYAFAQAEKARLEEQREQKRRESYARAALRDEADKVRSAPEGTRNDALNRAAFALAGFLDSGLLTEDDIADTLADAAGMAGLGAAEIRGTLRSGIKAGAAQPRTIPEKVNLVTGEVISTKPTDLVTTPSAPRDINDLFGMERRPTIWYAPGFLREGLGLLVGQPNVGKTPLAAQLAIAGATGGKWLGCVQMPTTKVLYLGVEYSAQELIPLFDVSRCGVTIPRGQLLIKTIEDAFPTTPDEALAELEWYIRSFGVGIIIIDVLTAFLPPERFKQNVYRGDYSELKPYHRLALQYNAAILGTWHGSKREADPRLMYNGSTGMWAAAASRITMYTDQDQRIRIASFPRMGDRVDWALAQERTLTGHRWVVGDANPEPICSPTELTIYRCLRSYADKGRPFAAQTITDMTGVDVRTVRTLLPRMFEKNLIQKARSGDGYYVDIPVAPVAGIAGVASVDRVAHVASQHVATTDSPSGSPKTPEQQEQRDLQQQRALLPMEHPFWASVPKWKLTGLRLYLRSNKESDQERARELCEEYGIDYDEARKAID